MYYRNSEQHEAALSQLFANRAIRRIAGYGNGEHLSPHWSSNFPFDRVTCH